MNIKIIVDEMATETEIIIRAPKISDEIIRLKEIITKTVSEDNRNNKIVFYKNGKEVYHDISEILFFETSASLVEAHTADDVFTVRHKLYELEDILPSFFIRVAKSTILNTNAVYSITRSVTSYSTVEFKSTHKKVFVSRGYFKSLKLKLDNRNI